MAEQELVEKPRAERPLLPRQPEVNIGTAGHVDHGKCLALDEYVLFGGRLLTGREVFESLRSNAQLVARVDGGEVYELEQNTVLSVGQDLKPLLANSLFFIQQYRGKIFRITTRSGRSISVTPEHPLLVNRGGSLKWIRARELTANDSISFLTRVTGFGLPLFPDPIMILKQKYRTVDFSDFQTLLKATNGFKTLVALSPQQLDQVRILAHVSNRRLSRLSHTDEAELRKLLDGRARPSNRRLVKIRAALSRLPLERLGPSELMAETRRRGQWSCVKLRVPNLNEDLAKWFAFVWAEGTSSPYGVAVAQSVQMKMLEEFLAITRKEFGLDFSRVSRVDYRLNSKALVDMISAKFHFKPGNERLSSIADWVLGMSDDLRAVFLRWFFTLDGEFNEKTGQIMISQANAKNTVVLSYMLQTFGIAPSFGKIRHWTRKGQREYQRLVISGRRNLEAFGKIIGFEDERIQTRMHRYLGSIKRESKESDLTIPISLGQLERLLTTAGLIREGFGGKQSRTAKTRSWYKAYSTTRRTNRISRSKLLVILESAEAAIENLERSVDNLRPTLPSLLDQMSLIRLSQAQAAREMGLTTKVLRRLIRKNVRRATERLEKLVRKETHANLSEAQSISNQLRLLASSPLEYDRIRSIETAEYQDYIFDLTVPEYANFIAGKGAIVAHNTSTVQAITGVWASAHSEELRRGITIKVGYADAAFYKCPVTPAPAAYSTNKVCPACGAETQLLRAVSFVDCPGHESLMTNMLAGAFLMDGALLVIAANEAVPKPQTREHLQALQMLGMKKIVIAQNKVDLVSDEEARKNYEQIENFVANTVAADAPIIPISAQQRLNIDALIEALEEVVPTPVRNSNADALMYVVRSFDVNKPGMRVEELSGGVLGGSLVRGELRTGDEIELRPGMVEERSGKFTPVITKVSGLQTGAGVTDKVGPGGLVAVGTHLDPTFTKGDQMVGSVIGKPGTLPPTWEHLTLGLELFETAVGSAELVKVEKVRPGENLRLNLGTSSAPAVVTSAREDVIEVDLKRPVAVEGGMRAAISRRIAERWRLIGSGVLK